MDKIKKPVDFFGDELQVGKRYVFLLKSGTHYQAIAEVESIATTKSRVHLYGKGWVEQEELVVKVKRSGRLFRYDYLTKKGWYEPYEYVKRIYNWESAIPVPEGK